MKFEIDLSAATDDNLKSYDQMMIDCSVMVDATSSIAFVVWSHVFKELRNRGLVTLVTGSFDNINDARIARNY